MVNAGGADPTTCVLEDVAVPHDPPEEVSVSVAVPLKPPGGVQVAFKVVALGEKVPPDGVDHVPPVAEPPTEPPNGADDPEAHIGLKAAPASAVGDCNNVIIPSLEVTLPRVFVNTAR